MTVLHAIWSDATLHIWAERGSRPPNPNGRAAKADVAPGFNEERGLNKLALGEETLRSTVGDVFDSLLVSGAAASTLTLRIPHRDGTPIPSQDQAPAIDPNASTDAVKLQTCDVSTLAFPPADAIDLLTSRPSSPQHDVIPGASLHYWSRVASLVLELLAKQRFVPSVFRAGLEHYRGYWRVVLGDKDTSDNLENLIVAMPPVCRSHATEDHNVQASVLLEQFLWTTVDALVRRCLEGDELAHTLQERSRNTAIAQIRWLRSIVRSDSRVEGTPQEGRAIHETVRAWLAKLEEPTPARGCRTCFRIQAPPSHTDAAAPQGEQPWLLKLYVQATDGSQRVLDAAKLATALTSDTPRLLPRPFDNALEKLRTDAAAAAQHFAPLAPCAEPDGPVECHLDLAQAYAFLRDAVPMLESEGFGVWTPQWWRDDRPRLRMWLDVRPEPGPSSTQGATLGLDAFVTYDWRIAVGDQDLTKEELAELIAAQEALVPLRDRWTEVPFGEVRAALDFVEQNRGGRMTVFEALRQCYIADDLDTGLPVAGLRPHGWIGDLFNTAESSEAIQHLAPPEGFHGELRPYQLRGLDWLAFLSRIGIGGCLADDMGLGKTIQLIALWLHERKDGLSPGPTLLVVPMSLVGNWEREIQRFAPTLKSMIHHGTERLSGQEFMTQVKEHDVVISTYGLTHRDFDHLSAVAWHRVALDEAQNIKNPAAKQAKAIRSLNTIHRVALTGTPVENRLTELWSILEFLNPDYLGRAAEFRRRFAVPIERYHDTDRAHRLRQLIRPFVLRRLKNDPSIEVDLPAKMEMKVFCNLTAEQAALYQSLVDDMLGQIDRTGGMQRRGLILATLIKLKQVCNHPAHFLAEESAPAHRSGKCDRLTEMLEEVVAEGDQALIFTQFRRMGDLLQKLLKETLHRETLFLHGGSTRKQRDAMIDRFQSADGEAPLLVLSLKAGGYGLNLTAASHVFHFDRWWNPAVEDQATDRAHRIGQDKRVQVHKFVSVGTLEERIDALLERKRSLAETVVGGGEDWLTELSTEKLKELFVLSRDAVAEG